MTDALPGIRRIHSAKGFRYAAAADAAVRDEPTLARIRKLAIPPAWAEVWICPDPQGHLQATGRDARGRKQYRYHPAWREVRDENKYARLITFAETLPRIRRGVERDLARSGLEREKVLATVVRLLERTGIRVGNEEYVRANRSFGLTTLRDHHVKVAGARLRFQYRGKSGKQRVVHINDGRLASIIRRCREIPGYELFQYLDPTGRPQSVSSSDVNDYLRRTSGDDFTAKHFRTWNGTVAAALALERIGPPRSAAQARRNVAAAIARTAELLGNTPSVARKCYVHPAVIDSYLEGELCGLVGRSGGRAGARAGLSPAERRVLDLLRARAGRGAATLEEKLGESLRRRSA